MKKAGVICLVLVMALGLLGAAYALWDKQLYVDGTIDTGEVNAYWLGVTNFDAVGELDPIPSWLGGGRKDKDVGWCEVSGIGTQTLTITVNNGYPCYYNDFQCDWTNSGTIPVIVNKVIVEPIGGWSIATSYGADDGPVWIQWSNGEGSQVDPGEWAASSLHIHVEQQAEELAMYQFTVTLDLVQWNEHPQPWPRP